MTMMTAESQLSVEQPKQHAKPTVFLAYPFNERDEWIKYSVPLFLRQHGCNVLTGERYLGREIKNAIMADIGRSNLLLAFLTKHNELKSGRWGPSEWVLEEIGFARGKDLPVVVIRDKAVDADVGILGDIQIIEFDADLETYWMFPQLRSALRDLLFHGESQDGLAVCHLTKPGRKDRKIKTKQWWDFWMWIDGLEEELSVISEVNYEFPEQFDPAIEKGDRHRAFGNYSETDGPITIKVKVRFDTEKQKTVKHQITYPDARISRIELEKTVNAAIQ